MSGRFAILETLGIAPISPDERPQAYAELFRAARRLRDSRCSVVGLLPASANVAAAPVALQLGLALSDACAANIAVVDGNTRRPAWPALAAETGVAEIEQGFVSVQVTERLWVTTAARARDSGLDLALLQRTIERFRDSYAHVLVDLTGFEVLGEQWLGCELVDGVLIVARAGLTKERELLERSVEVPAERNLGVLLVG